MNITPETAYQYQAPSQLLAGRTILITGAGDGIGRAAALSCAQHGATVILVGKTLEKLEQVYDEIEALGAPQPAIYPIHLGGASEKDYNDLADTLAEHFPRLDGLLHNAGMLGERKALAQYSANVFTEVLQTNLTAGFLLTKALLPLLENSDDASVVFTSSGVGRKGRAFWGAYAASKFATEGLVQVWADELANISSIRINAINPGATNTQMRRTAFPAEPPTDNPEPGQIMPAYLYLLGSDSKGITGASINAQAPKK